MKILVIGSGGREHALAWRLNAEGNEVVSAPGNPGMAEVGDTVDANLRDVDALVAKAVDVNPDMVIVGPEEPLVLGIADRLNDANIPVFGPSVAAARIEGSKHWANELMRANGIPCPSSETFDALSDAVDYVRTRPTESYVIKADGLAAGKGVIIPQTLEDAQYALIRCLEEREFGDAGAKVVIEDRLTGPELSAFGFVDGETVSNLVAARDYKRRYDGDAGLNTGGMGAYTSPNLATDDFLHDIRELIFLPTVAAMERAGCPYRGVLYTGLMLTESGPQVIEFNCRFGDPECEPITMRLESNLAEVCHAVAESRLDEVEVRYNDMHAVGVVAVSDGYPESYETGFPITAVPPPSDFAQVFHAGTASNNYGDLVTAGGRVMVATAASESSLRDARNYAYDLVRGIEFRGASYRNDIALDLAQSQLD